MDEETKDDIQENQIAELANSVGWSLAKERLNSYIAALESVSTLPQGSNELVGEEAKVRARAIGLVQTFIGDIEGVREAKDQDANVERDKDYILRNV